ncbi:hypothetical protein VNI00_008091 [Paramarasmius palmivorus]|uniref:Uncharacterized protein n=1 Tax=Paramarasmius palmivorus TaxID=297713 RepID=A0AAW0CXK6_9AGAR
MATAENSTNNFLGVDSGVPRPTPPPQALIRSNGYPLTEASPLLQVGDDRANLDLRAWVDAANAMQPDDPPDPDDDNALDEIEKLGEPKLPEGTTTFPETPEQRMIGRTGLSREQTHFKLATLHEFGARGLIKLVPDIDTLRAIFQFSEEIQALHRGKANNDDIGISRRKTFPPGNYKYSVVGVLCSKRFLYSRERLIAPPRVEDHELEMVEDLKYKFSYQRLQYPLEVPPWDRDTEDHLKGYTNTEDDDDAFDTCRPVRKSPKLEPMSWQDPWLVTANVGEFLYVLKNQIESRQERYTRLEVGSWPVKPETLEDKGKLPERAALNDSNPTGRVTRSTTKSDRGGADSNAAGTSRPRTRSKAARSNPDRSVADADQDAMPSQPPPTRPRTCSMASSSNAAKSSSKVDEAAAVHEPGPSRPRRAASKKGTSKAGSKSGASKTGSRKGKP